MKMKFRLLSFLSLYFLSTLIAIPQDSYPKQNTPVHEFSLGYGLFSMREVVDATMYSSVRTSGLFTIGYNFKFNENYDLGIIAGYEEVTPVLKSRADLDSFFIKSYLIMAKVKRVIATRKNCQFYMSGSVGIKETKQKLISGYSSEVDYGYEFVLLGLNCKVLPRLSIYIETAYGDFCLIKSGVSVKF